MTQRYNAQKLSKEKEKQLRNSKKHSNKNPQQLRKRGNCITRSCRTCINKNDPACSDYMKRRSNNGETCWRWKRG